MSAFNSMGGTFNKNQENDQTCHTHHLLERVNGYENKHNNLVFFPSLNKNDFIKHSVIYFGGDIQDFPENMNSNSESRKYKQWNLVSTGELLQKRYPNSSIILIRPNEMKDEIFSRFSNFVPYTNERGDPEKYDPTNFPAFYHLQQLLIEISNKLINEQESSCISIHDNSIKLTIIGFSKGCVVLNQLFHELNHLSSQKEDTNKLNEFILKIREFVWLDSGHNAPNTMIWPVDEHLIQTVQKYNFEITVAVTPFQVRNPNKKKHQIEYTKFIQLLSKYGIQFTNTIYFDKQPPSLDRHFELLKKF
ncbi:unnamed protein product [Didymodactylos carnosus]|nr:unnamed protein product [Didymodactylos carnosus]CAF3644112.1 unnamed protein product [Didymodactylos carnosus]